MKVFEVLLWTHLVDLLLWALESQAADQCSWRGRWETTTTDQSLLLNTYNQQNASIHPSLPEGSPVLLWSLRSLNPESRRSKEISEERGSKTQIRFKLYTSGSVTMCRESGPVWSSELMKSGSLSWSLRDGWTDADTHSYKNEKQESNFSCVTTLNTFRPSEPV